MWWLYDIYIPGLVFFIIIFIIFVFFIYITINICINILNCLDSLTFMKGFIIKYVSRKRDENMFINVVINSIFTNFANKILL